MTRPANSETGLKARRGLLQSTLRALDEAIDKSPDNLTLKARRAELADELKTFAMPGEIEWMRRRLTELDAEMSARVDSSRLQELVREREQLFADITETQRWAPRAD